jgi:hypothetical protein
MIYSEEITMLELSFKLLDLYNILTEWLVCSMFSVLLNHILPLGNQCTSFPDVPEGWLEENHRYH